VGCVTGLGPQRLLAADRSDASVAAFVATVDVLMLLRDRGWVRFPDGRLAKTAGGTYVALGPVDLMPVAARRSNAIAAWVSGRRVRTLYRGAASRRRDPRLSAA
jgi:hypothetical protein